MNITLCPVLKGWVLFVHLEECINESSIRRLASTRTSTTSLLSNCDYNFIHFFHKPIDILFEKISPGHERKEGAV